MEANPWTDRQEAAWPLLCSHPCHPLSCLLVLGAHCPPLPGPLLSLPGFPEAEGMRHGHS